MAESIYLYGVIDKQDTHQIAVGINGAAILRRDETQISVLYSVVNREWFTAEDDLAQLQTLILQHDTITAALASQTGFLPIPFGTLLPDDTAIAEFVTKEEAQWHTTLGRIGGRVEYTLKAYIDEDVLHRQFNDAHIDENMSYLKRKQALKVAAAAAQAHSTTVLEAIHTVCEELSAESLILQADEKSDGEMLALRTVHLMRKGEFASLLPKLETLLDEHDTWLSLETGGPFAPWHFVEEPA